MERAKVREEEKVKEGERKTQIFVGENKKLLFTYHCKFTMLPQYHCKFTMIQ